jgi:hypothetical protein
MTTATQAILVALAIGTANAGAADAATIHVANNGLDVPTCGGAKSPCRSIGKGLTVASDGDTIEVGPGLYGDVDADGQFTTTGDEPAEIGTGCECMIHVTKAVTVISRSGATQTLIHAGPPDGSGNYAGAGYTALVQIDTPGAVFGEKEHGFTVTSKGFHSAATASPVFASRYGLRRRHGGNFVIRTSWGSSPAPPERPTPFQTNTVG